MGVKGHLFSIYSKNPQLSCTFFPKIVTRMQCNSEFMFDEQWMKKTSQDLTLDFF